MMNAINDVTEQASPINFRPEVYKNIFNGYEHAAFTCRFKVRLQSNNP